MSGELLVAGGFDPATTPGPAEVIAFLEATTRHLQVVEDPREAIHIVKQADALRYLAQKADASAEVQNQAAEVALRARRKAGELLAAVPRESGVNGGRPSETSPQAKERFTGYQDVLRDSGLMRDDGRPTAAAERYQQLAKIPEDRFEQYVSETQADGRELTTSGAVSIGRALGKREKRLSAEKPKVEEAQVKAVILRQDALTLLGEIPAASVDLLLTDPPYMTDVPDVRGFAKEWVPLALSRVKPTGRAYICTGSYPAEMQAYLDVLLAQDYLEMRQILVWTYRNTLGPKPLRDYALNWQAIHYLAGPDAPPLDCDLMTEQFAVQDIVAPDGRLDGRLHAWEKPSALAERLIRHSTSDGALVLDPFAGTGTFIATAARLGRNAMGAEVDLNMLRWCAERGLEVREAA